MKVRAKITIIVVENRESYYFIIICKYKEVPLSLFLMKCWLQLLTTDERSSYYKVYASDSTVPLLFYPKTAEQSLQCVNAYYCGEERTSDLSTFLTSHGQYPYTNSLKLECKTWHSLFDLQVHGVKVATMTHFCTLDTVTPVLIIVFGWFFF